MLLNCLTDHYSRLWETVWEASYSKETWSKKDTRLNNEVFQKLTREWNTNVPFRTDFMRRQALVEIDVLVAMKMGITLDQLKEIYSIQFPVLQAYEADTWFDANGRIVFTNNRSLTGVGYDRKSWEAKNAVMPIRKTDKPWDGIMKHAPEGFIFARTITDNTMPWGPVERTIEYVAPFDRCNREEDYETAWDFFERKNTL